MKFIVTAIVGITAALGGLSFFNKTTTTEPGKVEVVKLPASNPASPNTTSSLTPSNKSIEKHTVSPSRVLYLNDQVTYESVTHLVNQLKAMNAKSSEPIYLLIDSPGGSVLDGATLISEMEASKAPVNTVCTRLCASMAAMIHSYGAKRYSTDRAILMYHPASAGVQGQVPNMLSQLTTITRYIDRMVAHQVGRSKMSADEFAKRVAYEFWVESEDALNYGLDDGIVNLNVTSTQEEEVSFSPPLDKGRRGGRNISSGFDVQWVSPHLELWARHAR